METSSMEQSQVNIWYLTTVALEVFKNTFKRVEAELLLFKFLLSIGKTFLNLR